MIGDIIVAIFGILLILWGCLWVKRTIKKQWTYSSDRTSSTIGIVGCSCIYALVIIIIFASLYSMSYQYLAISNTVDDTTDLLTIFNNTTSMGQGLEALELKQTLSESIKERNQLEQDIRYALDNPLIPFKCVLRERIDALCIEIKEVKKE